MKNKLINWTIFGVLFVILSSMAFATPIITVGDVLLSETNAVERSNPELYGNRDLLDDTRELKYVTFNIPVTVSNGTGNVTNVNLNIPSAFNYAFGGDLNNSLITQVDTAFPLILTNSTQNVVVRVLVPENLDAIDSLFKSNRYDLNAVLTINNGTNDLSRTSNLGFYVENNLEIRRASIIIDDISYRCVVRTGRTDLDCDREIQELEPGKDFTLELEMRNLFRSASRIDIEDIEIDIFDERDVEADSSSYSERRIRAGEDLTIRVGFRVDSRVEDGDRAKIEFTVFGIDTNSARHGFAHDFEVRFELPRAKVEVDNLRLSRTSVCPGDSVVVAYTIENLGTDRQRDLQTQVTQPNLGWDRIESRFELDGVDRGRVDSRDFSHTFFVPANANKGDYNVNLELFYRDSSNRQTSVNNLELLRVIDCTPPPPPPPPSNVSNGIIIDDGDDDVVTPPPTQPTGPVVVAQPRRTDSLFVIGMIVLIVLMIAVIASMVVFLVRK